jgi:hypothetical protein
MLALYDKLAAAARHSAALHAAKSMKAQDDKKVVRRLARPTRELREK